MAEYSRFQKKVIERYYDRRDAIMLNKLQELVTEIYLAEGGKKQDRLWERIRTVMVNLKIQPALIEHLVTKRDPSILAKNVQTWLAAEGNRKK